MRRRRAQAQVLERGKAIEEQVSELGEGKQHGLEIKGEEESSADNLGEDEYEGQARRERARAKMRAKRELEEVQKYEASTSDESRKAGVLDRKESQGSEDEEGSDEWETATESENEDDNEVLLRPTFVPRGKRQQQEGLLGAAVKVVGKCMGNDEDNEVRVNFAWNYFTLVMPLYPLIRTHLKVQRLERHRQAQNLVANVIRREEVIMYNSCLIVIGKCQMCLILSLLLQEEEQEAMETAKEEGSFADMPTGAAIEDDADDKLELESWKVGPG